MVLMAQNALEQLFIEERDEWIASLKAAMAHFGRRRPRFVTAATLTVTLLRELTYDRGYLATRLGEDGRWTRIPDDPTWEPPEGADVRDDRIASIVLKYLGEEHQMTVLDYHGWDVERIKRDFDAAVRREEDREPECN
jgi:hypothetical protein